MNLTSNSKLSYNTQFITADGRPVFPVMGEIHYSRVRPHRWERELLKMKAGGVDVISAYTIWIHHEEIRGAWDFSGSRDLRRFVETVKHCGLSMVLRIGPWAHGEVRNGGFPDWLIEEERLGNMKLRSDDPSYLACVRTFYEKLMSEVAGLLLKDGGPIIGIQIENEYGHCGGLQGEEGETHMRTLLAMAKEAGFEVPLYTATGWGGAVTGGMLPVMGGYCEAPWDQRVTEIEPSGNYIFTKERNDHNIGSDHGLGVGLTFDMGKFPYLTAELGGGLQVTKHRRPIASARDIAAMSMVKLGSGCNLLGYYMYHGGTNPDGKLTTLQESRATGYPNDLPVRSYDFNAPVREYGQLTDTYRELRRLTMFTHDYEELLCRTSYIPQPGNPEKPEDLQSVRTAVRAVREQYEDGREYESGFLFLNNYQRRYPMAEHEHYALTAFGPEPARAPLALYDETELRDGDFFFYPFNLKLGEALLEAACALPLCILRDQGEQDQPLYVFYVRDGRSPAYRLKGDTAGVRILTLTDEEALHASKITVDGREHLFISEGDVVPTADGRPELHVEVRDRKTPSFRVWPELAETPEHFRKVRGAGELSASSVSSAFAEYVYEGELNNPTTAEYSLPDGAVPDRDELRLGITVRGLDLLKDEEGISADEVLLRITYAGNTAELYQDGKLVADNFYTGQCWETGIRDLEGGGRAGELTLEACISPLREEDRRSLYLQEWPELRDGAACRAENIETSVLCVLSL